MCGSLEDRKDAKNGKHGLARRQIHIENEREYNSEHQLPLVKSALLRRVAMATLSDKVPKVKYLLLGTVTVSSVSWWLSRSPAQNAAKPIQRRQVLFPFPSFPFMATNFGIRCPLWYFASLALALPCGPHPSFLFFLGPFLHIYSTHFSFLYFYYLTLYFYFFEINKYV